MREVQPDLVEGEAASTAGTGREVGVGGEDKGVAGPAQQAEELSEEDEEQHPSPVLASH